MFGVKFDEKHTYTDFGLCCTALEIGLPTVKKHIVNLKGADGFLDLTEVFGRPLYGNRKLSFQFDHEERNYTEWMETVTQAVNYLHGKKRKIILDNDASYYYEGRATCKIIKENKVFSMLVVDVDAAPYKRELRDASEYCWNWDTFSFINGIIREYYDIFVDESYTIVVMGSEMPVMPIFYSSAPMTVTFKNREYAISAGETKPYGMVIEDGENTLTFTGRGLVSIGYRGGKI